jgi:hypothetical protein
MTPRRTKSASALESEPAFVKILDAVEVGKKVGMPIAPSGSMARTLATF